MFARSVLVLFAVLAFVMFECIALCIHSPHSKPKPKKQAFTHHTYHRFVCVKIKMSESKIISAVVEELQKAKIFHVGISSSGNVMMEIDYAHRKRVAIILRQVEKRLHCKLNMYSI